jgi:nucleotide-binding universal stress UspA family protein
VVVTRDPEGSVVVAVGVDGNGHAVDWAAAEAAARGCALHVVHAAHLRWMVDPFGLVPVADLSTSVGAAEQVLQGAVTRARSVAPDVAISAQLLHGPTVRSLLAHGRGAQLLVLGSRHPPRGHGVRGRLVASVGGRIITHARCPVAVVRGLRSNAQAGSSPRVVVGVDTTASSTAALGVAFRAAAQRGLSVTALHAWTPDTPADHEAVSGSVSMSRACARMALDRVLSPWLDQFVDVPVDARLICAEPADALIRESAGAALVVVGSRGRGTVRAKMLGSVSLKVAQLAHCPIVVIRPDTAASTKETGIGRRTDIPVADLTGTDPVQRRRSPWE